MIGLFIVLDWVSLKKIFGKYSFLIISDTYIFISSLNGERNTRRTVLLPDSLERLENYPGVKIFLSLSKRKEGYFAILYECVGGIVGLSKNLLLLACP